MTKILISAPHHSAYFIFIIEPLILCCRLIPAVMCPKKRRKETGSRKRRKESEEGEKREERKEKDTPFPELEGNKP